MIFIFNNDLHSNICRLILFGLGMFIVALKSFSQANVNDLDLHSRKAKASVLINLLCFVWIKMPLEHAGHIRLSQSFMAWLVFKENCDFVALIKDKTKNKLFHLECVFFI